MTTLTCTRGLPASGKTTWATQQLSAAEPGAVTRVNRDDLRKMLHSAAPHLPITERQVTTVQHGAVESLLRSGVDVIVDDTNLRAKHLRTLAELAWKVDAEFMVRDFTDVPLETCLERDSSRTDSVGEQVIRNMHARYLAGRALPLPVPPHTEQATGQSYVPDPALPRAVMVDIDGTVALHVTRDPYDTSRYHEDVPNAPVVAAVHALLAAGYEVVFCSGRDEEFRDVTERWLGEHVTADYAALFMRKQGDRRRDDVIKLELFDLHIRDRWRVEFVIDDRDRVVAAWRSIGLTVLQCAEGAF